jgi:hypothetical protein
MSIEVRTKLATLLRMYAQGVLTESALYHRVADLLAETECHA